jgi:hypothetical protein
MTVLRRVVRLPRHDVFLLFEAVILLGAIRLTLWLLRWRRAATLIHRLRVVPPAGISVERLVWAVRHAGRVVPGATCLARALALDVLLCRAGYDSSVQIGVAKESSGRFVAHAWVEHNGQPLLDTAAGIARYSRLVRLACHVPAVQAGPLPVL